MTALLQRLKNLTSDTPITQQQETGNRWVFRDELEKKGVDFFQPLVRIHPLLEFEYDIHRGHLFHSFASKAKESQKRKLTLDERAVLVEQLKAALAMAELLAHLYYYYLNVHCQKLGSLQDEQKYYRQVLSMMGHPIPAPTNLENEPTNSLSKLIKDPQSKYNWRRLFTIRIRRVFITLLPFLQNSQAFPNIINGVDRFLGPTLNYVAWVFYVPRLTVNLILLFKHLFPNQWTGMAEKEEELGWLVRLESQLQRRGLELGNDMAWFIGGILGCFLFIGGLAPIGWYVTVSIFFSMSFWQVSVQLLS